MLREPGQSELFRLYGFYIHKISLAKRDLGICTSIYEGKVANEECAINQLPFRPS